MNDQTITYLVFILPLLIGGIIALLNSNGVNETTEKAEAWIRKTQTNVNHKKGKFNSYIANPILWMIVKFGNWTDSFSHRGVKNGVRVTITLYLVAIWCLFLYAAFVFIAMLAAAIFVFYIILKVFSNSDSSFKESYSNTRKVIGVSRKGTRVHPETGIIQEKGLFGWTDTDERIDPATGKLQEAGLFGYKNTGTRVNQDTGTIQKDRLFGYSDTNTRVHPETGIIQKNGLLGWQDTDERIDPKTGKHQKNGIFGWSDD